MRFKKNKIAKCQFRVPLTNHEYGMLENKYEEMPDSYKNEKSVNMYLADLFSKQIRTIQTQMNETNRISLTIDHPISDTYSIYVYAMLYPEDQYSLDALSKYIGYSRVNLFRYLILKELY